jgi:low temperature requirement protein LtrA
MVPRGQTHAPRTPTPLELFFDLCFVVAVAALAERLHHALAESHFDAIVAFFMVFFAIWWAWMNFTWFASAYDCDDVPYRVATLVQIAGVLVLAAGVPRAFDSKDFSLIIGGYAIMRLGLVAQWLRAARSDPAGGPTGRRYAAGVAACMLGWSLLLIVAAPWKVAVFVVMAAAELAVPLWAERHYHTPWNAHHVAERYGLFTLIVLGETVLTSTLAIRTALDARGASTGLLTIAACGLAIVFAMWWIYFGHSAADVLRSNREAFPWGYGHYFVFASAAAVGSGIGVAVDENRHIGHVSEAAAVASIAVPVAVYTVGVWFVHVRPHHPAGRVSLGFGIAAALVLLAIALPMIIALLLISLVLAGLVAVIVRFGQEQPQAA